MASLFIPKRSWLPSAPSAKVRGISTPAQAMGLAENIAVGIASGAASAYRAFEWTGTVPVQKPYGRYQLQAADVTASEAVP